MAEYVSKELVEGEEDRGDGVICGFCNTPMTTSGRRVPKLLDCLHSFCFACLEDSLKGTKLRCFLCEASTSIPEGVDSLEDDFVILGKLARAEVIMKDPLCGNCELKPSTTKCMDCDDDCAFLCTDCSVGHAKMKAFRSHKVISLSSYRDSLTKEFAKNGPVMQTHTCNTHPGESLMLFCETCDIPVCRDCILHEHRPHTYVFAEEASRSQKRVVLSHLFAARSRLSELLDAKNAVCSVTEALEVQRVQVTDNIRKCFSDLVALLAAREKLAHKELDNFFQEKSARLKIQEQELEHKATLLRNACDFTENALASGCTVPLFRTKNAITARLQYLKSMDCILQPVDCADIDFRKADETIREMVPAAGQVFLRATPLASKCTMTHKYCPEGCYTFSLNLVNRRGDPVLPGNGSFTVSCVVFSYASDSEMDEDANSNGIELLNSRLTDCTTSVCEWNVVPVDMFACLLVEIQIDGEDVPGSPLAIPGLELEGDAGLLFGEDRGAIVAVSSAVEEDGEPDNLRSYDSDNAWLTSSTGHEWVEIELYSDCCVLDRIVLFNSTPKQYKLSYRKQGFHEEEDWIPFQATPEWASTPGLGSRWSIKLDDEERRMASPCAGIRLDVQNGSNTGFYALNVYGWTVLEGVEPLMASAP
eukprot:gene5826-11763_t